MEAIYNFIVALKVDPMAKKFIPKVYQRGLAHFGHGLKFDKIKNAQKIFLFNYN